MKFLPKFWWDFLRYQGADSKIYIKRYKKSLKQFWERKIKGGESHHLILDLTYSYNNQDWYWGEDGHTDQWNRAGSPDIHKYGQPIIYKFLKAIQLSHEFSGHHLQRSPGWCSLPLDVIWGIHSTAKQARSPEPLESGIFIPTDHILPT